MGEERRADRTALALDAAAAFVLLAAVPQVVLAALERSAGPGAAAGVERRCIAQLTGLVLLLGFGLLRRGTLLLRPDVRGTVWRYLLFLLAWLPLAMVVYPAAVRWLGLPFKAQASLRYLAEAEPSATLALVLLVACVLGPIGEELVFRGFLWRLLEARCGRITALVGSSVLFGALHEPAVAIPIALLGAFFGWLRLRTGGCGSSILAHIVHNGWTVGAVLCAPQLVRLVYDG